MGILSCLTCLTVCGETLPMSLLYKAEHAHIHMQVFSGVLGGQNASGLYSKASILLQVQFHTLDERV